jgi:hypothetical protein
MLEHPGLGSPLKIGDKAYRSTELITPLEKSAKSQEGRGKPEYRRLCKWVETVFVQLTQAHIRSARVALTLLAHILDVWLNA